MYVSTAHVLRQFAQKLAQASHWDEDPFGDKEPAAASAADAPGGNYPVMRRQEADVRESRGMTPNKPIDSLSAANLEELKHRGLATHNTTQSRLMQLANNAGSGIKNLGGMLTERPGAAALGAGAGAASLYALARAMQSEEDRKKKKTPWLMPTLGAVGGGIGLPMLLAALGHRQAANAAKTTPQAGAPTPAQNMSPAAVQTAQV